VAYVYCEVYVRVVELKDPKFTIGVC
jgi:hypothetical protein